MSPIDGRKSSYTSVSTRLEKSKLTATGNWLAKRDALYGRNVYCVDTRLPKHDKLTERYTAVVAVEAFKLFNHSNYGTYNRVITSMTYGALFQKTAAAAGMAVGWRPRSRQFLARFEF